MGKLSYNGTLRTEQGLGVCVCVCGEKAIISSYTMVEVEDC